MRIETTEIPDVTIETLDQTKQELSDKIIRNVYPLFDEIYNNKSEEIKDLEKKIKEKKKEIFKTKTTLEESMVLYKKNKKIHNLLERIAKLNTCGLIYDSSLKNEMVILLKVLDSLSEEKLDHHLNNTMKIISKRFSKH